MTATPVLLVSVATMAQYDGTNMADVLALLDPARVSTWEIALSSDNGGVAVVSGIYPDEGATYRTFHTGDWMDVAPGGSYIPEPIAAATVAASLRPYVAPAA